MHSGVPVPGSVVWIRRERWRVRRARRDGAIVRLEVANPRRRMTFLTPFDRAHIARDRTPRPARRQRALARLAGLLARADSARGVLAALDADIEILPHQLEPVLAVLDGTRRVLVADDAGLGKTIQAGLTVAEFLRRRIGARILILAPAGLRDQWQQELRRRVGVSADIADAESLHVLARAGRFGERPLDGPGVWLASFDYLKQPHVVDALPTTLWDLLVIDEAHDVSGNSARHAACDALARRARHVILLTATPHSGDPERFDRLRRIGELPGLSDPLVVFRRTRAALDLTTRRRVHWHATRPSEAEARLFDALLSFERALLRAAGHDRRDAALLLLAVFRKRALSTVRALETSLRRRLAWIETSESPATGALQQRLQFGDDGDEFGQDEDALTGDVGCPAARERAWIGRLLALTPAAARREMKISTLVSLLRRSHEPAVVFTEFRHSLEEIVRRLVHLRSVAALHGGQSPGERRTEMDRFLGGDATVLVATDVAGQGLNLQTAARWVINVELPWNPVRLEQRIGRVDRLGQVRRPHFTLLVARHPAEAGVLERLARRVLTARRSLGNDVLADAVPPAESAVAATLLEGAAEPAPVPSGEALEPSRAWQRSARAAARQLVRRRTLARLWRAAPDDGTPVRANAQRAPRLLSRAQGPLFIFSVPIVDRAGWQIERCIVPVRVADPVAWPNPVLLERARAVARVSLEARRRRLERLIARRVDASIAVERAIALVGQSDSSRGVQTDLFTATATRAFFDTRERNEKRVDDLATRLAALSHSSHLEVGVPTLEILFVASR